eukprot:CAMPEP_0205945632 /NCGR_PEP_ID=MMETSP1325-20131115/66723_1 /ASSEMBLY_ACC=CAM_ASM_000708 /TAXON_ID=236786 /ORGANISM="Florenciella sp., Strain RCC1007" /LENGTH=125 /DNA_ID=CAMNT_0053316629 /DNA_START=5 /DNA_END=379 /DNA_ORIENTATION=+
MPSPSVPSTELAGVEKCPLYKLDELVARREKKVELVKGSEAKIFWADSPSSSSSSSPKATRRRQTEWALCCIHGWSGSREENEPTISQLAKALGANMYCGRLSGHGRGGEKGRELLDEANPPQLF